MNGVLYINGDEIGPCELNDTYVEFANDENIIMPIRHAEEATCTFTVHTNRNDILSLLYGRKITNNWLRMHGGVMARKRCLLRRL